MLEAVILQFKMFTLFPKQVFFTLKYRVKDCDMFTFFFFTVPAKDYK